MRIIENLSKYIDHTYLKPEATEEDIRRVVKEAIEYNFATVFVAPSWIRLAREFLREIRKSKINRRTG